MFQIKFILVIMKRMGLSSYEQYLFMPIDSYNVFCVLNDKKCICKYLPAKVCTGEYKNKVRAKTLIKK